MMFLESAAVRTHFNWRYTVFEKKVASGMSKNQQCFPKEPSYKAGMSVATKTCGVSCFVITPVYITLAL